MPVRRTVLAVVAVLAVVGAAGVVVIGPGGGADDEATTTTVPPSASVPPADATDVEVDDAFTVGAPAEPYRIDYRVEDPSGQVPPSLDQVLVEPPFRSRLEIHPPGGGTPSLQVGTIDRLLLLDARTPDQPTTVARVPALAPAASRVAPVLDAAVAAGVLERRGQRRVAGRRCQVLRTAQLLEAGPLRPLQPGDHVDTCVDADGLVLEEVSVSGGDPVLVRTAVRVETDVAVDDELFETGPVSAPPDRGGGATTPADPASAPEGPVFELPAEQRPEGFELVGRFSVVPPQPERFEDPGQRDAVIAGIADVWQSGGDVLVVYQGRTLGGVPAFEPVDFAAPVTSATLGDGELLLSPLGSELRFPRPEGRFVHVFGTLPPPTLGAVADALVERQGTGLELLEG